ncbi:uncharacterized protein LOC132031304 isoform X1 [Lycium ferocissimum]|uniref:uncharacterized protein LOC132031304 isoform X1 n=1 Tax=Lycium ferocissimum TaxID=112874 RepID=UPI0028163D43|nr:uncharacterized protein LOC132031304 isoform X1 [Lycium ferocissimum]
MTSRRTSHLRAARKNDEKKDAPSSLTRNQQAAESDSSSDLDIEAILRLSKEEEARQAELRRKKREDAFRFSRILGIKEMFLESGEKRNFNDEKQFSLNGLKESFPRVLELINKHDWDVFTDPPRKYNQTLVREFYAVYVPAMKKLKWSRPKKLRHCLDSVQVRGVWVECHAKVMNKYYFARDLPVAEEFNTRMAN